MTSVRTKENALSRQIKKVDRSDLKADYDAWPELGERAWNESKAWMSFSDVDSVLFCGMGGSGITGALLCDYANEMGSARKFSCLNDYHLPRNVGKNTLVIAVSCSGSTDETLSAVSEAQSRGLRIASFGSGGPLEEYSAKIGATFTRTAKLKVPRSSFPGIFFSVLRFCADTGLLQVKDEDVLETCSNMKSVRKYSTSPSAKNGENSNANNFARKIFTSASFPVIYSSARTRAVGLRFRQSLNENAKIHAFDGVLPEACHNDVVGWDGPNKKKGKPSVVVALRLPGDLPEIKTRYEILSEIIRKRGGRVLNSPFLGGSYLSQTISMLYFLDYVTFYLAVQRGIDPIKTPSIDTLKRELGRRLNFTSRL